MKSRISILTLLCCLGVAQMSAQSPGGVAGAELWLRAAPVYANPDSLYHWRDLSGDDAKMKLNGGSHYTRHRRDMQAFNFHPAFHLPCTTIRTDLTHSSLDQTTIIGAFAYDAGQNPVDTLIYGVSGRGGINMYRHIVASSSGELAHSFLTSESSNALRILSYQQSLAPSHSVWGDSVQPVLRFEGTDTAFFCPEIIVYGRMLSQLERRQVESYLALRHGVTLQGSYYAPDGSLLWDYDESNDYHNRVTGIACWPQSYLDQPLSTTSYESGTLYASNLRHNDAYWFRSCLNKPTDRRLLVMGREYACPMPDDGYLIWGDNGGDLSFHTLSTDTLWHKMGRVWKYRTNLPWAKSDNTAVTAAGASVTTIEDGLYNIYRPANSASSSVTFGPASASDVHVSFSCPAQHPLFSVGITYENDNTVQFGYVFYPNGAMEQVIGGLQDVNTATGANGHWIDISLHKSFMSLSVDGRCVPGLSIEIPMTEAYPIRQDELQDSISPREYDEGDEDIPAIEIGTPCLALINVTQGDSLRLNPFRVGGFSDTGNQVELSCSMAGALTPSMADNLVMLAGSDAALSPDDSQIIPCSEIDTYRNKLIFHHVRFEEDSAGYFTFALHETPPDRATEEEPQHHAPSKVTGIDDITVDTTDVAALRVTRNAHRSFTALLTTEDSGQAQLLVFDAAGRLLGQYPMTSSNVRTADFTVPVPGVYIVKALTDHNECSTRIISD